MSPINYNDVEFMLLEYKHQSTISGPQSQDVLLRSQGCHVLGSTVPLHPLLGLQVDKDEAAAVAQRSKLHARRTHCELLVPSRSLNVGQSIEGSDMFPADAGFVRVVSCGRSLGLPEDSVHVVSETGEGRSLWEGQRRKEKLTASKWYL